MMDCNWMVVRALIVRDILFNRLKTEFDNIEAKTLLRIKINSMSYAEVMKELRVKYE